MATVTLANETPLVIFARAYQRVLYFSEALEVWTYMDLRRGYNLHEPQFQKRVFRQRLVPDVMFHDSKHIRGNLCGYDV